LLWPVYSLFGKCRLPFQNFPSGFFRKINLKFSFFPTGFVPFMVVQPIDKLIIKSSLPALHFHAWRWLISMLFHFSTLLWKTALSANGIGIKPFLNRPILSRKMFVSPCPSHQSGTDRQINLSRPATLFLPAMFFSCHFLLHSFHALQREPVWCSRQWQDWIWHSNRFHHFPDCAGADQKLEWSGNWVLQPDCLVLGPVFNEQSACL
jgi:hypothetical protein